WQLVHAHGENGEQVTVRVIALRRAGSTVARRTEVSPHLQRSVWQLPAPLIASVQRQLSEVRREIDHDPVPEAAASRCVRVVAGDGKAPGALRRTRPR